MSFFGRVNQTIHNWLFKDEIQNAETNHYEQIGRQVVDVLERLSEAQKRQLEEIEKIKAENHEVRPTLADIDRYYGYYKAYVEFKNQQNQSTWNANGQNMTVMPFEQFEAEANAGGWRYLRSSVGLPLPDNDKGGVWHV